MTLNEGISKKYPFIRNLIYSISPVCERLMDLGSEKFREIITYFAV